jgi:PAS domain S-box-containing protein
MRPSDPPEQAAAALTQQHRAEVNLSPLEKLYRFSAEAILVTDNDGVIRGANPSAEELFGYAQGELFGKPIASLIPDRFREVHPRHRAGYNALPSERQMGLETHVSGLRKDGTEFAADIAFRPMETASGPSVLSFVRDVTEQRAKQETIQRFQNLFEFSPDGIVVTNSEGRICDANPRARELFGYSQEEFAGLSIESLVPERFRERHPALREEYNAHPRSRAMGAGLNLFGLHKDGSEFPVDIVLKPTATASGPIVLSFIRDVSEQRAAQEAARDAAQRFDNLFEFSPDGIFITEPDGRIRGANLRAGELFGYTPDEFVGMPVENLIPERLRGRHPDHRENYLAHPRARQMGAAMNLFGMRRDGSEFPIDVMLKPMETESGPVVMSFVRDTSEQLAAQEELRRNDQQLRSIVTSIRDYAIYLLDRDGYVITWNPGAEQIKGYTEDEILGLHFSRFFTQEDRDRKRPSELMHLAAARGRIEDQGWRVRKDGSRFWADSLLTAIRDSTGATTGYAKVTRDITDRKRAQESVMLHLSSVLLANVDVRKLLEAVSASIREMIPHDCATLGLYDKATDSLMVQFLGSNEGESLRGDVRLPLVGSPSGTALRTREPVLLNRIDESPYAEENVRHLTSRGMRSGCWIPLVHRGEAVGVLTVASLVESRFSPHEVEMLVELADPVAMAVSNAAAFRHISELRDRLSLEKKYLEEEINLDRHFDDIVGESAGLRQVLKEIETVAPTDATVLIQGETGTGKELLARAIHRLSPRADRTFIKLNCAAIPAGLIESELFGHEKGAFTGAIARKMGRLELANEGTLFLDEVGEMPLDLQPKLLRALQEREIERLGGTRSIPVNIRLIAATNRDLAKMVAEKEFRSDLYYRLKVFPIIAPPLRERTSDIPLLVRHFVETHSRRMGKSIEVIPDATMEALIHWSWPGNIRELENFLERAVILTRGPVLYVPLAELETEEEEESDVPESPTLRAAERDHILQVLREAKGQIGGPNGAAARLGVKRTTLNSKMKKLGIERRNGGERKPISDPSDHIQSR